MILASLSLIWAPAVSGSFGTLFQLKEAKPLAVSTGFASTTNTLATSAVAQWINQHRALTITTTVAAIGLVAAFAYVIKKYRDNQPPIIPPAPPVPPVDPARYVRPIPQAPPVPIFIPFTVDELNATLPATVQGQGRVSRVVQQPTENMIPIPASPTPIIATLMHLQRGPLRAAPQRPIAHRVTASPSSSSNSTSSYTDRLTKVLALPQNPTSNATSSSAPAIRSPIAPSSSSATTAPTPIYPVEPSSHTVLSSSTSSSTTSPSQGRRSPSASIKADADYREGIIKALSDLTPLLREQIQTTLNYLPQKTIQLSPEIKARLGFANNLTPEQLQEKLREICGRYNAGRELFKKAFLNCQRLTENNRELSEKMICNLLWFFYLYGGLQDNAYVFEEGTFTLVGNRNGQDNASLENLLGFCRASGAKERLASHFAGWTSFGIDIGAAPLPPAGKQHLLLGKGENESANRMYFKPENYGVSGLWNMFMHGVEYGTSLVRKITAVRKVINDYIITFPSDDGEGYKKERCPADIVKKLSTAATTIKQLHLEQNHNEEETKIISEAVAYLEHPQQIYKAIEALTNLQKRVTERQDESKDMEQYSQFEAVKRCIQGTIEAIAEQYPNDFAIRCGNEPCFRVQDLINAPSMVPSADGTCLLA